MTAKGLGGWFVLFVVLGTIAFVLTGCASPQVEGTERTAGAAPATRLSWKPPVMRLEPGDVIEVKFAYASQYNETQMIRPDGTIEMQLVGTVKARNKTPEELRQELMRLYGRELKHPNLVVLLRSSEQQRVYVGGAVRTPGSVEMNGPLTVLEAIYRSGGLNLDQAEVSSVVVVRNEDGRRRAYRVDLQAALKGDNYKPFVLQPRDIIFVPRSWIADVNLWVSQHMYKMLPPFSFGIGYSF